MAIVKVNTVGGVVDLSFRKSSHELVPILPCFGITADALLDLFAGVHHRRVVPTTKRFTDFRQAVLSEFSRQSHRHLTRPNQRLSAPW